MSRLRRIIGNLFGNAGGPGEASGITEASHGNRAGSEDPAAFTDPLMQDGVARHLKGDLDGAAAAYRKVLDADGDHVDALHLLGNVLGQQGQLDQASVLLERALALNSSHAGTMVDLGNVHRARGDAEHAMDCYQRAIGVSPGNVAAHRNLGYLQLEQGNDTEGLRHLKTAVTAEPEVLQDRFTLAELLANSGAHAEAIPHYAKAVELKPDLAVAHNHLAYSLSACGSHDAAIKHYKAAIALDPEDYVACNDFGLLLHKFAQHESALENLKKTTELNPDFPGGYINLGNVYRDLRRFAEARRCYEKALGLDPDNADAHNNLGTVLKDQGSVAEATECVRRALELRPGFTEAHSNLLMDLQYLDDVTTETLYRAHADWVRCHISKDIREIPNYRNTRDPDRPLRIGYLSPDLAMHPVGLFLEPVLEAHEETRVRAICYDDLYRGDAVTERLKLLADDWRAIAGQSDDRVAEMIQNDGIDILVDLAGHTANNRMRLFARKPAPVQATWIGYLHSTGLAQMDYLIADSVAVPENTRQRFSETVMRLPQCFLCYGQPKSRPEVAPPPALANGYVTFGCYNNLAKVSDGALRLWKKILDKADRSRLVLKNSAFNDAETRDEYLTKLQAMGFDATRIRLENQSAHGEYFSSYSQIDIALDPFPFSGGTISADALWMGVPVVTLAGDRMAGRTSASILLCLGLDSLVTPDSDAYVNTAVTLAGDTGGLASLRKEMRGRFSETAIGDAKTFTENLETAYRRMWRQWCRPAGGIG